MVIVSELCCDYVAFVIGGCCYCRVMWRDHEVFVWNVCVMYLW